MARETPGQELEIGILQGLIRGSGSKEGIGLPCTLPGGKIGERAGLPSVSPARSVDPVMPSKLSGKTLLNLLTEDVPAPEVSANPKDRTRVKGAIIFALTTVIPFLVLLFIIHLGFASRRGMDTAWVSCLALIALGIALLGGKLMREAWGKLARAVETIDHLEGGNHQLREAVQGKPTHDEIDRIPLVVNRLAGIAKKQREELKDYMDLVEVLKLKIEEADKELQAVGREDALTTLYNPMYFGDRMGQEIARCKRYKGNVSLAVIEVDFFKKYRAETGEEAGDEALSTIGKIIRRCVRETDLAFRFGEDQFAIIFPETTAENAVAALERVRAAVEKRHFKGEDSQHDGSLTLSIGVSMLGRGCTTVEQLVSAADESLEKAKSAGRNQLLTFSPE